MDVRFAGVRCRRDGRDVLAVPALAIAPGRTPAVLGPNGAGKTTLLRLIAGLERPQAGDVFVGEERADARRRCVSYAFQEDVFVHATLLENLALGLRLGGVAPVEARARALAALRLLGIETLAGRRPEHVSGGERRRASLARALCVPAPVLLLDEPMAGLDRRTYQRLLDDLPALLRGIAAATVVVTHDRDEAFRLCDDVVILVDGQLRAAGTKQEVAANPRRRDVAETLGYTVLTLQDRVVAVPENGLRLAPAADAVTHAIVRDVVDLVDAWDVIATLGDTLAHVRTERSEAPPQIGDRVGVAASALYDVC
jgi:ABC-type sulfate/molybdate transport systems ATPase subunit